MDSNAHSAEALTIPSELMGLLPRRVRLSGNCLLQVTIATTLLMVGVALALLRGLDYVHQTQHKAALREASAVIGNSEAIGTIDQLSSYRNSHSVRYSFIADNGAIYTGKSEVPDQFYASLQTSGSLPIRYLPADPTVNHPAAWEWTPHWSWFFGPMIFVVAGLFSLLQVRTQRRLVIEGVPAVAVITKCSSGTGRSIWFAVTYEFRTEDGEVTEGSGRSENRQDIGTKICVLYLPENPKRSLPYASANYRAVE